MYNSAFGFMNPGVRPLIYLILVLDLVLKGITLYKSAQRDQKVWFIALLVINSMGILPTIYLISQKDIALTSSAKPATKKSSKRK